MPGINWGLFCIRFENGWFCNWSDDPESSDQGCQPTTDRMTIVHPTSWTRSICNWFDDLESSDQGIPAYR